MIENRPFATRARTLDHLGREQIADVPTAVSELWKNAYDAYATDVKLRVMDSDRLMVTLIDNGHGMSKEDIIEKWLVVGTDSKLTEGKRKSEPHFGLNHRIKQGQKGIGRLSSAHLGPLMLMITKSQNNDSFIALLIDWRTFENPYLILSDITTPLIELNNQNEIAEIIPALSNALCENITPIDVDNSSDADKSRNARIREAWRLYDEGSTLGQFGPIPYQIPSESILQSLNSIEFNTELIHPLFDGELQSKHGTALVIWDANEELLGLFKGPDDESHKRFIQTLAG
ncbi:ATP-binding protein, partial [Erwinia sp.]|uniref:ATP-binding protein n=1 Tax=Erwinia citreus TaxID=558 RepID=UPI003C74A55B